MLIRGKKNLGIDPKPDPYAGIGYYANDKIEGKNSMNLFSSIKPN